MERNKMEEETKEEELEENEVKPYQVYCSGCKSRLLRVLHHWRYPDLTKQELQCQSCGGICEQIFIHVTQVEMSFEDPQKGGDKAI